MKARRPWTPEEERLLRQIYADTPASKLATIFGRSGASISAKAERMGLHSNASNNLIHQKRQELWRSCSEYLTDWESRSEKRVAINKKVERFTGTVVDISDLHIPWTQWDKVDAALDWANKQKGGKILISGGDEIDQQAFSFFKEERKDIPVDEVTKLPEDWAMLKRYYAQAAQIFDAIYIINSNHMRRLHKWLSDRADTIQMKQIEARLKTFDDMMDNPKLVLCPEWYQPVGDVWFVHADNYSSIQGRTVAWCIEALVKCLRDKNNLRACIQAHTHTQSKINWGGVWGVESGCMAKVPDYTLKGTVAFKKGQKIVFGFAYARMENGHLTSPNDIQPYYLGEEWWD